MSETKPEECECCGFETTELTAYSRTFKGVEVDWVCTLCASTMASRSLEHTLPEANTLKAICYVGNAIIKNIVATGDVILKEIRKGK